VILKGQRINDVPTYRRITLGLAYIPQRMSIFRWMSVEDNILLGGWTFRHDKERLRRKLEEISSASPSCAKSANSLRASSRAGSSAWWNSRVPS